MNSIVILVILFISSVLGTYIVRIFTLRNQILDVPNARSSHSSPTPRGGGLSITVLWYLFLIIFYLRGEIATELFLALCSGILITFISFLDDLKGVTPGLRLFSQLLSVGLALFFLGGLESISYGSIILKVNPLINIPVAIAMLWMINLFNFLDGIDGYLGSEGVFIFSSLFIFSGLFPLLAIASIILGFLVWNWPKAKIFSGDIGSTLIGFTVVVFSIHLQNINAVSLFIPLILTALFWGDATITLFRRIRNREKLSEAHRKHAYQRLVHSGYSHGFVLIIGMSINIMLFLCALITFYSPKFQLYAILACIAIIIIFTGFADKRKAFSKQL